MNEQFVRICEEISSHLILRDQTDLFFEKLNTKSEENIVIDFSNVVLISRSFADQYILRKARSHKRIAECNLPENVQKMFQIVTRLTKRSRLSELNSLAFAKIESADYSLRNT